MTAMLRSLGRLHVLHVIVLVLATGALYLLSPNNEFIGQNDLYHTRHSVTFADFFNWSLEDLTSANMALYKILLTGHALAFYPHGPLPPFVIGIFYRIMDVLNVPFSAALFQLPTALYAMAAVFFFYISLRRAKLEAWIALLAALLLACSPIFVASSRGIATYWAVAITFNQAFALYALQGFDGTRKSKLILSLSIIHILLSDMLSFLTLLALFVGYAIRRYEWSWSFRLPIQLIRQTYGNLGFLNTPIIYVPAILIVLFLTATSMLAIRMGELGGIPLYPALFFWTFPPHGGEILTGNSLQAFVLLQRFIHALGEMAPLLLIISFATMIFVRTEKHGGFLWSFAWIGSLGYGILFYVLADAHPTSLYLDQMYVLVPFVAFAAYQLNRLVQSRIFGPPLAYGTLGIGVVGALTSAITLTWSTPLSLASDMLIVDPKSVSWHDALGVKVPNVGTRAAGYIARKQVLKTFEASAGSSVVMSMQSSWHPRTYTPFLLHSGLSQNGDWFANQLGGDTPSITYLHVLPKQTKEAYAACGDSPWCVAKTSSHGYATTYIPLAPETVPPCKAQFCSSLSFNKAKGAFQHYDLYRDGELQHVLQIRGVDDLILPPGRYDIDDLDERFENEFTSLWDYFPQRPKSRIDAMMNSILSRF